MLKAILQSSLFLSLTSIQTATNGNQSLPTAKWRFRQAQSHEQIVEAASKRLGMGLNYRRRLWDYGDLGFEEGGLNGQTADDFFVI